MVSGLFHCCLPAPSFKNIIELVVHLCLVLFLISLHFQFWYFLVLCAIDSCNEHMQTQMRDEKNTTQNMYIKSFDMRKFSRLVIFDLNKNETYTTKPNQRISLSLHKYTLKHTYTHHTTHSLYFCLCLLRSLFSPLLVPFLIDWRHNAFAAIAYLLHLQAIHMRLLE